MPTRTQAAAVGQAHMTLKEKWTLYKCIKSVLVPGTALFMMWTEDDLKLHPSTFFQGNVRIASLQGVAGGLHVFVFKDNVGRKVRAQDMDRVVSVSNNILASRGRLYPCPSYRHGSQLGLWGTNAANDVTRRKTELVSTKWRQSHKCSTGYWKDVDVSVLHLDPLTLDITD